MGLSIAPKLSPKEGISIDELDYLVMPYNSLGSTPVFEAVKKGVKVFAIKENSTVLNVSPGKISNEIIVCETYNDCLNLITSL